MSEETVMQNQMNLKNESVITAYRNIPYSVISEDMTSEGKTDYFLEVEEIINLYAAYKKGVKFFTEGAKNYIPSDIRFKKAASIINKEARFLFANPPTFNVNINDKTREKENTILQDFLLKVLEKNMFNNKLLKAAKDCFIGKRVALMLNFNDVSGITITFLNALEFIYESTGNNELTKIVTFYEMTGSSNKSEQRWFKKIYELIDEKVYLSEIIYDGAGTEIEVIIKNKKTKFTYIPAVIVLNDGLTGETEGVSELGYLTEYESIYSKLTNSDFDAERKSMNPINYTVDASSSSTKGLSSSPGAYWDIQSDLEKDSTLQAKIGTIEPSMNYSSALKTTLDRIENNMYSEVDVPNINGEQLKGVITSGKTLKALYWGLSVRCDEKMLAWYPALQFMAETIIEGGKLYPTSIRKYTTETILPDIKYIIKVENNYPLPEDIEEEKTLDMSEVNEKLMSRKTYIMKWRTLSPNEAEQELQQIKLEQDLFENSQFDIPDEYTSTEV